MEGIYVKCNDDVLIHHGVKNQKWGVRRYQNKDGSLTALGKAHLKDPSVGGGAVGGGDVSKDKKKDKKKEKELSDKEINKYSSDVARGDYGNWGDRVDRLKKKGLSANDIIKIQGKVNESLGVKGGASKQFQDLVKSKFPKTETKKPTQTKKATSANKEASKPKTSTKKVAKPKRSNSEIRKQFDYTTKVFKASAKKQKNVKHSDTGAVYVKIYDDYLEHHGIKGQKWGRRRYQNADGSLTAAGRARYGIRSIGKSPDEVKKMIDSDIKKRKAKQAAKEKAAKDEQIRKEKAARDRRMRTGPGAASEAVNMTEKDVRDYINKYKNANELMKERSTLDTYIDKYSPKERTKLEKVVDTASKLASVAESTSKIKNAYDSVMGKPKPLTEAEKLKNELDRSKLATERQNRQIAMQNFLSKMATEDQNRRIAATNLNSKMKNEALARKASRIDINQKLYSFNQTHETEKARKNTMRYVESLSDTDLASATDRYRRENEALDFLFKYSKY